MTDQKDPNWVPPWENMGEEGFLSGDAFEQPLNDREIGKPIDFREIRSISIPGAYGGKFGITMADDLMKDTGMTAKELIASSSINDNADVDRTVFGTGVHELAEEIRQQLNQGEYIFTPEGHPTHKFKFGEVSWNPEIKGLEKISGRSVLPASYPYNSVVKAISAMGKEDTIPTLTLPLSDDMKLLLSNQSNAIFLVDYSTDIHRGREFLEQFKDLPCAADVVFSEHPSHEEYEELLRAFMTSESIYQIPILITAVADVVLVYRGNRFDQSPYSSPFTEDYVQYFLARNASLLDRWLTFCDSMLLFGIYAIKALNKHYRPEEHFPLINDAFYIGSNVALLMRMPEFSSHYFAIENVDRSFYYFKQQFETDCFDGEGMLKYFRSKNNYLRAGLEGIAQGHFKPSDVGFGIFNKGVFAPDYPIGEFDSEKK